MGHGRRVRQERRVHAQQLTLTLTPTPTLTPTLTPTRYMRGNCPLACGACPKPKYDGPQATARVYNAWDEEDEGGFIARYTAKHVESHEARVLIIGFGPRAGPLALARLERAKTRGASSSRSSTAARGSRAHGAAEAEVAPPAPASREVLHSAALRPHGPKRERGLNAEREPDAERERDGGKPHERSRLDLHLRATHAAELHLQRLSLRACTYEYGPSLLSLYVATALLAAMVVHVGRQFFRGKNGLGKHAPGSGRARAHIGEDSTPRRC